VRRQIAPDAPDKCCRAATSSGSRAPQGADSLPAKNSRLEAAPGFEPACSRQLRLSRAYHRSRGTGWVALCSPGVQGAS